MSAIKIFVRCGMVIFWLGIFGVFLFVPQVHFFTRAEKSIAILAWPTDIDSSLIADFERETGIRVYVSYFQDYGELFVKLRSGKGLGYDLVTPVDYIVKPMIDQGLLKPLDKSRCMFWSDLNPQLLDLYYDKGNYYSLPYFWGVFGIGINRDAFFGKDVSSSWKLLFDEAVYNGPLGMLDDAKEVVTIAVRYLSASTQVLDKTLLQKVQQLLLEQKKRVVMYTDNRAPYLLLSRAAPVVLTLSYEIARLMELNPAIDFLIPQEGSFLLIDNWAIPASSTKDDLVYTFLNYMYRKDILKRGMKAHFFYPPVRLSGADYLSKLRVPTEADMQRAKFIVSPLREDELINLWIALKA
jgi:spermidine/putrescine transport system substrate-binding protein